MDVLTYISLGSERAETVLYWAGTVNMQLSAMDHAYEPWSTWATQAGFENGSGVPSLEGHY